MTTACTRCGAATADQVLTAIGTLRREHARSIQAALLCPACWASWWRREEAAAASLEAHLRRPAPQREGSDAD